MKRPSFQFYPSDWLRDTALRSCSTGARGLWMDMICYMHEGNPYGHLKVGNKVIHFSNLARMVGESEELVEQWLNELFEAGVYDLAEDGSICSRRMIKDENLRNIRAAGGKLGGNPLLKDKHKDNHEVKQKQTPSSSSSSSSSLIKNIQPEGFDLFWDAYNKKTGKPNSIKEWKKINPDEQLLQIIIAKAKADKAAKPDDKFRKDPERWLKGQHWLDEIIIEQAPKAKELPLGTEQQIEEAYRVECGGDPRQARFNSYFEMKKFILDKREEKARA
jgi:hypothetical protein